MERDDDHLGPSFVALHEAFWKRLEKTEHGRQYLHRLKKQQELITILKDLYMDVKAGEKVWCWR